MHEEMYKLFFRPQIECPDTSEDVGLSSNHTAAQVDVILKNRFLTRTG